MKSKSRIGIIDIGSNSVRLVVYELLENGAYHVVDESKDYARLSQKIRPGQVIAVEDLSYLIDVLQHYKRICQVHSTTHIRVAATAAIRNASNQKEISDYIKQHTAFDIEILSGDQEAWFGLYGALMTLGIDQGYIIDLGGGSTEISFFKDRAMRHSVSLPIGCVNMAEEFLVNGEMPRQNETLLRKKVQQTFTSHWREKVNIKGTLTPPLIGIGGTIRSLAKIDQRRRNYSFPTVHHYEMNRSTILNWSKKLRKTPLKTRKGIVGLSKAREDIIVPGAIMVDELMNILRTEQMTVSSSGLRDALLVDLMTPNPPLAEDILDESINHLLSLYPARLKHVRHVHRIAMTLFDHLQRVRQPKWGQTERNFMKAASQLFCIGAVIDRDKVEEHTHYLLQYARLNGLNHREQWIVMLIASFRTSKGTRKLFVDHLDILEKTDFDLITRLGTLLRLAAAMDRSGTQPITRLQLETKQNELRLAWQADHSTAIEERELALYQEDFMKAWSLRPVLVAYRK